MSGRPAHACGARCPAPLPRDLPRTRHWALRARSVCEPAPPARPPLRRGSAGPPHAAGDGRVISQFHTQFKGHSPSGLIGFGSLKLIVWVVKLACLSSQFREEAPKSPAYYEAKSREKECHEFRALGLTLATDGRVERPIPRLPSTRHLAQDTRGTSNATPPAGKGHRDAGQRTHHLPHRASSRRLTVRSENHTAKNPSCSRRGLFQRQSKYSDGDTGSLSSSEWEDPAESQVKTRLEAPGWRPQTMSTEALSTCGHHADSAFQCCPRTPARPSSSATVWGRGSTSQGGG